MGETTETAELKDELAKRIGEAARTGANPSTSDSATPRRGEATYVVQMQRHDDGEGMDYLWEDVATVTVPAKTKRKTVIAKAIEQIDEMHGEVMLRVIPAAHAEPTPVEWEQPPPQLRIG